MSQNRDSIVSLLITVVFLVLIAVTAVIYRGDNSGDDFQKNFLLREVAVGVNFAKDFLLGPSQVADKAISEERVESVGFAQNLSEKVREEWNREPISDLETHYRWPLSFNRTEGGLELVWSLKDGGEHKLQIPLEALSDDSNK